MEENRLKSEKIPKLLLALAAPAICAQIVTLLYNLVDRIYIGRLEDGAIAMAAIGICAPIVTVVTAFTGLFGRSAAGCYQNGRAPQRKCPAVYRKQFFNAGHIFDSNYGTGAYL